MDFYDLPDTGLPNTNNALEGVFSDIKSPAKGIYPTFCPIREFNDEFILLFVHVTGIYCIFVVR